MSRNRAVDGAVGEALDEITRQLQPPWEKIGPVLEVVCDTAGATRQVAHGLGAVPDGYLVHLTTGAVYAVTPERWTEDLALLTAPVANTYLRVQFYLLAGQTERV